MAMRGIFKRERSPFYWISYAGPDGRIIRESTKSKSYREAEEMLLIRKRDVLAGSIPAIKITPAYTFFGLSGHYIEWATKQRSIRTKLWMMKVLVQEFGNLKLSHFTTMLAEGFQSKLMAEGKAPATVNRYMALLKHCFTKAYEWEMVGEDVLKKVRRVKMLKESNQRTRYLSKEESHSLIEACASHLKPIVITALNTGMRKEEILSLEWEKHIDLRHGFIYLDQTKNGEGRTIPINGILKDTFLGLVRRLDSPYVFTDEKGRRFKEVTKSFYSACKKAGIRGIVFHSLRHTFASQLVMAGVDLMTVKELLGHKSLTMTLRYSHLAPSHKVKALNILQEAMATSELHTSCTLKEKRA